MFLSMGNSTQSGYDLNDLRKLIDETDRDLLNLMEKRAQLALAIGKLKGRNANGFDGFYRPSREMHVLNKIVSHENSSLPKITLIAIWREIISSVLQMQSPFSVAICDDGSGDMRALARNQFGISTPILPLASPSQLFAALASKRVQLGLLAFPGKGPTGNWWLHLSAPYHVLAHLSSYPFQGTGQNALVIGQAAIEETGRDRSLIDFSCEQQLSCTHLCNVVREKGFAPSPLDAQEKGNRIHYLLQMEGFVEPNDPRFQEISSVLPVEIRWIGAYACPLE